MKWQEIKETIKYFKKTYKYAKENKNKFIIFIIFSIIMSITGIIFPIFSAKLIVGLTEATWEKVIIVAIVILLVELTNNLARFFGSKAYQVFFRSTLLEMQTAIAEETLKLKVKEIDKNSSGVFIDRLNKDASDISNTFIGVVDYITLTLSRVGVLFAIFIISKILFFYFVIALVTLYYIDKMRMKNYFKRDKIFREINEKNTSLIGELIRGIRDIKVLNVDNSFLKKTKEKITESNNERYKMSDINRKYNLLGDSLRVTLNFIFIILGIYLVIIGNLSAANLVVIYMYQERLMYMLENITALFEKLKNFNLSAGRVFEIIENTKFEKEEFGTKVIKKVEGNFEFKNVCFGYEDNLPVLKNMSFKVKANETIGFVGTSGGGKSTVFSLIDKLYIPDSGEILIDGININELNKESIRDNISIITQMPYIFNFSIRENLELVKPDGLSEKEMHRVCKAACLHDFIMTLPNGYDTTIGEGGISLSGGQRQRLAIARALLKKTEIILFDEATSALDNETQKNINDAINNMKGKFTILIIAHRLSTIKNCDKIFVIDEGKVVGEGSHIELLKKNKKYKELYKSEITE